MTHACDPSTWGTEADGSGVKEQLSYMMSSKAMWACKMEGQGEKAIKKKAMPRGTCL